LEATPFHPVERDQWSEQIENALELDLAIEAADARDMRPRKAEIVLGDFERIDDLPQQLQKARTKPVDFFVGHSGVCPLDHDSVAAQRQQQRLAQIPAADIDVSHYRKLDDVTRLLENEMLVRWPHIDETTVVIAVRRGKTPGAAAAFYGEKNPGTFRADCFETGSDRRNSISRKPVEQQTHSGSRPFSPPSSS
jgi:hypothetical protein